MRYSSMTRPVMAITTFFPTEDLQNSCNRFIEPTRSQIHYRLSGPDRLGGFAELLSFLVGECYFNDPFQTRPSQLAGNTTEHIPQAVLPLEPDRARQNSLSVQRNCFDHLHRGSAGGIVSRSSFEKRDNFGAAISGAGHNAVELVPVDQLGDGDAGHR